MENQIKRFLYEAYIRISIKKDKSANVLPKPPQNGCDIDAIIEWFENCGVKERSIRDFPEPGLVLYEYDHEAKWVMLSSYDENKMQNSIIIIAFPEEKHYSYVNTHGKLTTIDDFDKAIELMCRMIEDPYSELVVNESMLNEYLLSSKRQKAITDPEPGCTIEEIRIWLESNGVTDKREFNPWKSEFPTKGNLLYVVGPGDGSESNTYWVSLRMKQQQVTIKPKDQCFVEANGHIKQLSFEEAIELAKEMIKDPSEPKFKF